MTDVIISAGIVTLGLFSRLVWSIMFEGTHHSCYCHSAKAALQSMVSFCKICNAFCEWRISKHIRSKINISNYLSFLISIAEIPSSSMFAIGGLLPM